MKVDGSTKEREPSPMALTNNKAHASTGGRTVARALSLCLFLLYGVVRTPAQVTGTSKQFLADFLLEYMDIRYKGLDIDGDVLYVSVQSQRMYHVRGRTMLKEYVISTSAKGLGEQQDSYRTPTGLHYVRERIGTALLPWSILRERVCTGYVFDSTSAPNGDVITSRILWLSGMEAGVNEGGRVDSYARNIYIHGTADEASLGSPSSHGCIRMRNQDVINLFNAIPVGALVVIYDN
jgi:L,D-transpeptidase catalytic domain